MKTRLRLTMMIFVLGLAILSAAIYSFAQEVSPAQAGYSHVRIVRLSFVEGTVSLQRPDLTGWAAAPANTPIQEGFKLSTAENSFTEVEFENASTVRLGQLSLLDFNQLVASPNGGKINRLTLEQGYATFNVFPEGIETFDVKAQDTTITLAAATATRFRVDIDQGTVRVEVFMGAANVSSPSGKATLTKNMLVEINSSGENAFNTSQGITKDAWDQWVDERDNQQATVRNSPSPNSYPSGSSSMYGWNDLSNYGDWSYFSGLGYGWTPGVGTGWSPFMAGQWCWYPGMGYTWISYEPWGWLPYHYGGWFFEPGFGWAWFPGSFGAWSPGNVNWSQGQGWVGWTPQGPAGNSGVAGANCTHGQYCGRIVVKPAVLQDGRPVNRSVVMKGNFTDGQSIKTPGLQPSKLGMMTGAPRPIAAFAGSQSSMRDPRTGTPAQVTSGNNTVVVGESTAARPSSGGPGIVFNSDAARYENGAKTKPETANGEAAPASSQDFGEAGSSVVRPAAAGPSRPTPANARAAASPGAGPSGASNRAAPVARPSHSVAPTYQPSISSHSYSGGSRSSSSEGIGGARSGGGTWGSSAGSAGGGASSGGGSHSSGSSSSSSTPHH